MKRLTAGAFFIVLCTLSCAGCSPAFASPSVIDTIILAESSGRPNAIGDGGKARGLMQIQESTWKRLTNIPWDKAFDPKINKSVGTLRVQEISRKYKTSDLAFIAYKYNCGDHTRLSFEKWKRVQPNKAYRSLYK